MSKTITIGDVHGCREELDKLLEKVGYQPGDRVITLGDLVDRGPDDLGVIRRCREIGAEGVLGNHDDKLIRYAKHEEKRAADPKYRNPMFRQDRQAQYEQLSPEDVAYLKTFKPYIEFKPGWVAVHAGVAPRVPIQLQDPRTLRVMRYLERGTDRVLSLTEDYKQPPNSIEWFYTYNGPLKVVFGHWVVEPHWEQVPWAYPTDYGCVFGRQLAAWVFNGAEEPELVKVEANTPYDSYDA